MRQHFFLTSRSLMVQGLTFCRPVGLYLKHFVYSFFPLAQLGEVTYVALVVKIATLLRDVNEAFMQPCQNQINVSSKHNCVEIRILL